jgi:hypothetical protein
MRTFWRLLLLTTALQTDLRALSTMDILFAGFLIAVILLTLDLLTAPKYSDNAPRPKDLKPSRRSA